jgi:hypothetical protein
VYDFRYELSVTNLETIPVVITVVPLRADPGANSSNSLEFAELPYSKSRVISAAGGNDRTRFTQKINLAKFWGDPRQYMADDNFSAGDGASPNISLYLAIGAYRASGTFTNGVAISMRLTYTVRFSRVATVYSLEQRMLENFKRMALEESVREDKNPKIMQNAETSSNLPPRRCRLYVYDETPECEITGMSTSTEIETDFESDLEPQ